MHYLTQDEVKKLVDAIPDSRQRIMIKLGFVHGLRISELINLTKTNIRDGYLIVQRLKGSEKTTQQVPNDILKDIYSISDKLGPKDRLFPITRFGAYKLMQRAGKRAGIPAHKLHPHVLKHSCAMGLINSLSIHELQEYLGHKSLNSTGAYLSPDEETVSKKAVKSLAGVFV